MLKRKELKQALKEIVNSFLDEDEVEHMKLQKINEEKWDRIITALKYELNTVGIKVK